MDSGRKRRYSQAATPSTSDGNATKKLKLLNSNPAPSAQTPAQTTAEAVQKVGLKLVEQVRNATDKNKRPIADAFLELPPRDQFPDYYQMIRMPLALDTIKNKLRQNLYPTISAIERDFKRMTWNAKEYNLPKSDIYEDSERIRKLVYNYMKTHNPAYADPAYHAEPTPFVEHKLTLTNGARNGESVKQEQQIRPEGSKTRISLVNSRRSETKRSEPPSERKPSAAPSASVGEDEAREVEDSGVKTSVNGNGIANGVDRDFTGKSFEDAQRMIVKDLIERKDGDGGIEIFTPFVTLPSRKLEDYYKIIRHPVSLKSVQKRTHGIHGRDENTGVTDFKSWDAFEEEVSFIWRNCREYNEDGSEMYELAGEFEETFKALLAEAKSKVDEPAAARLKLAGPKAKSGVTLNLHQHRNSPTPGVSVDSDALLRQRQMVQAGVNGEQTPSRPTPPTNGATRPPSQAAAAATPGPSNKAQSPPFPAVKHEKMATMSPAPGAAPAVQPVANGLVNGTMPPPVARPASNSPFPGHPGMPPPANGYHFTAPAALPPTPLRAYPIAQALLPVVAISTIPQLQIPKPHRLIIPPHPSLSHQSATVTLPPTHHILQIAPTISKELSMGRPYKMFVTLNGGRLTQRDTQFHADSGKRTHVYEGQLASGVNRIEVEVAAAKVDADAKGLDIEKVTVYASLTR